jgi:hypothetical protein
MDFFVDQSFIEQNLKGTDILKSLIAKNHCSRKLQSLYVQV